MTDLRTQRSPSCTGQ